MTKNSFRVVTAAIFALAALGIAALLFLPHPWESEGSRAIPQNRMVIPRAAEDWGDDSLSLEERLANEESSTVKVAFAESEIIAAVLNGNFSGDPMEEQFVAYRNSQNANGPVYLTFIGYDPVLREYKRLWTAPTAAARMGTVGLYTQDILGDRSVSVLLSGMNDSGEHTLTIFRLNPARNNPPDNEERFSKIAELRTDGNITVREVERTQAYQLGIGPGQSFTIVVSGRDFESANIMDQIETTYAFNAGTGLFEPHGRNRIPGAQVEQRLVKELLDNPEAFREFIAGLWFHVTPQGTIDGNRYIYFNPASQEVLFFEDGTLQIFTWRNSIVTRLGLYINSQNISISTLRRAIDIQLESLNSIRIRLIEDIRPQFRGGSAPWDGSYRKAFEPQKAAQDPPDAVNARIDAVYDSAAGKIRFFEDGTFEQTAGETVRRGQYAFFRMSGQELLELRFGEHSDPPRETFVVEGADASGQTLTLSRVRISVRGIERLDGGALTFTLAAGSR